MARSYKLSALFLILSLLVVFAYAQAGQADQGNFDAQNPGDAAAGDDVDPTQFYDPEFIKQQQESQRTKLWGCYFLAKNRLFSKAEDLGKLMAGNKGEALFKRMAVDIMKRCMERIDIPLSQKILSGAVTDENLNAPEYQQVHGFNVEDYKGEDVKLDLEGDEKFIYEYYQKIDESVRNHWEEQADKEESAKRRQRLDYEPHIGGLSLKGTSPFVKTMYTGAVIGTIAVLFFLAYKKLFATSETPYEKLKRERAEKKKGKAQ